MPRSKRPKKSKKSKKSTKSNISKIFIKTLFFEFMIEYNKRNNYILSSDTVFSNDDIKHLSNPDYLRRVRLMTGGHMFSYLELGGLLQINKHSTRPEMINFIEFMIFIYKYEINIQDFFTYLEDVLKHRTEPELLGGINKKFIKFLTLLASTFGTFFIVFCMTRSLEQRTRSSATLNAIVALVESSGCPMPKTNPALAYFIENGWFSERELQMLTTAFKVEDALSGGCDIMDKYNSKQFELMLPYDLDVLMLPYDLNALMLPYDGDALMSPPDGDALMLPPDGNALMLPYDVNYDTASNAVLEKVKFVKSKHNISKFELFELIAESFDEAHFNLKLKDYELNPESPSIVDIKNVTSVLDVLDYFYGGIKGQVKEYWSDLKDFRLNPIKLTDNWSDMKRFVKYKIMFYKHLVDNGMMLMETANDELWAWIKHAGIIFVLTKTGICFGFSLLVWMVKELKDWRNPATTPHSNSIKKIKTKGGKNTKKHRKRA